MIAKHTLDDRGGGLPWGQRHCLRSAARRQRGGRHGRELAIRMEGVPPIAAAGPATYSAAAWNSDGCASAGASMLRR
jgi:hypothetical protein